MNITKLSSKGQIIIPKPVRTAHDWEEGQEFVIIDTPEGLLFQPKNPFDETKIHEVAGCLKYHGQAKTIEQMNAAIATGIKEKFK